MPLDAESDKLALIDQIADLARSGTHTAEGALPLDEAFVRAFYRNVPPADILARPPGDLLAAASALWHFMAERRPGKPKLCVLRPAGDETGWMAGRTIVQIVNDDMPFLVNSVSAAAARFDLTIDLVIHPVVTLERDREGRLIRFGAGSPNDQMESVMHIALKGRLDEAGEEALLAGLETVLSDVRAAVVDWQHMRRKVQKISEELTGGNLPVPALEATEVSSFLTWLCDGNFTFLGYREYEYGANGLMVIPGVGKGLLRNDEFLVFEGLRNFNQLSPDVQQFIRSPQLVLVSKSNRRSTVHRPVHMDTIGIKTFNEAGEVVGQKLIIGLFTSSSYSRPPRSIPLIRRKVAYCLDRSGFAADSHDGKALQHILDSYPRDELFQIDQSDLFVTARGILHLQERQRIALFVRRDPYERFASCLVYVPRDRYNSIVRHRMAKILEQNFNGKITSDRTHLDDSVLARIHFIVKTQPGQVPDVNIPAVEQALVEAGRIWLDTLTEMLTAAKGEIEGYAMARLYADAFPTSYAERFGTAVVADIASIETVEAGAPIALTLYQQDGAEPGDYRLKTFHRATPIALSDVLPILENLGLRVMNELPFEITLRGGNTVWLQEFEVQLRNAQDIDFATVRPHFEQAFAAIWTGTQDNDGFNRLVLRAGLTARETIILRSYCKFLRQAGSTFSQAYMEDTLGTHPGIAHDLVRLFHIQFDPALGGSDRTHDAAAVIAKIDQALDHVTNLDEDRILRSFLLLITKSLRTNYYQRDEAGLPKSYLSIKLSSQEITLLPLPRPLVEIFVYSTRMEGVHLRGGKVARGGIRWSDRKEDFRTEILGLMKAQMVKNSVIVPVGSKGGFVAKRLPQGNDREALMAEVIASYKTLMTGLLDITDTIKGDHIEAPCDVVRRDGDDPYLVVAADKGTATFSDIANGVAIDYGFWLGDAFASGGSIGYDHKAMGITARGAWEAVKRHFRELGTDIQRQDFTCIGVGDMSGDVFGNGMLLSQHTCLLAAFNHQHIFLDPNPDPARSWTERKRLFDLPRSSWLDYDGTLISQGGGVFERSAKSIALSPAVKARFGIAEDSLAPAQLIQHLLKQPVDLLWFGGIGTYVKASTETQLDAGDRANDALRVDGQDLAAKVIGEGANLAMTQRGRVEFALKGGRLNTDAIDNSAGVDTSDHEVNIKIAVSAILASGKLTADKRTAFLATMTDDVGLHVLRDNYLQTQALTLAEAEATKRIDQHITLMKSLEKTGRLDRAIEYLPNDESIGKRIAANRGLTRPELAVLLAYAKNAAYPELLHSDLPDQPELEQELLHYFPQQIRDLAADDLKAHRLRREIIATIVTNDMINRMGPSFVTEMQAKTGKSTDEIARAYLITRDVLNLKTLWDGVEALDNRVAADSQTTLLLEVQAIAEETARWFLQSGLSLDIAARTHEFLSGVEALSQGLGTILPLAERQRQTDRSAHYQRSGVPAALADAVVALPSLAAAMEIVRIEGGGKADIVAMGQLYFAIGAQFGLGQLRALAETLPATTSWQRQAIGALLDDFSAMHQEIINHVLSATEPGTSNRLDQWMAGRRDAVRHVQDIVVEITRANRVDLAMMTVAGRQLRQLMAAS